jgi:hypothetical protein
MIWPLKRFSSSPIPPEPAEGDHYFNLENATRDLMGWANKEFAASPDNHHLEIARNHLSDAYLALWRANHFWERHHRDEAG